MDYIELNYFTLFDFNGLMSGIMCDGKVKFILFFNTIILFFRLI